MGGPGCGAREPRPDLHAHPKDVSGRVIGVEILHYRPATGDGRVRVETVGQNAP